MRSTLRWALGALALASLGVAGTTPANAQSFGFSFGTGPAYGGYYSPAYRGYYDSNPCAEPYAYRPAYCYGPVPAYRYYRPYRPYYGYRDRYWDRGRYYRGGYYRGW